MKPHEIDQIIGEPSQNDRLLRKWRRRRGFIAAILYIVGFGLLLWKTNAVVGVAVLLILMAGNIERKL